MYVAALTLIRGVFLILVRLGIVYSFRLESFVARWRGCWSGLWLASSRGGRVDREDSVARLRKKGREEGALIMEPLPGSDWVVGVLLYVDKKETTGQI